jgi:hypothetical protein
MPEKIKSIDRRPQADLCFLLCDATGDVEPSSSMERFGSSPRNCMDKAMDEPPQVVVVRFGKIPIRKREALVELCAALKRNSRTRASLVLALVCSKHRKLVEDLERAQVDYVRYVGDDRLTSDQIREVIHNLGPEDRLKPRLAVLCPFLHYDPIDTRCELIACGAYLDRMVLGGRWLHEICETDSHLKCEYYLNPRIRS